VTRRRTDRPTRGAEEFFTITIVCTGHDSHGERPTYFGPVDVWSDGVVTFDRLPEPYRDPLAQLEKGRSFSPCIPSCAGAARHLARECCARTP
jgi:hypothetical protein